MFLKSTNFIAHFIAYSMTKRHRASNMKLLCCTFELLLEWERQLKGNRFWNWRRHFECQRTSIRFMWGLSNQHLFQRSIKSMRKRSANGKQIAFVDNETSNSMIHFKQMIRHKRTEEKFRRNSKAYQCDAILSMKFPVFYHFTTSKVQYTRKFQNCFGFDSFIATLMRFHEMDFVSQTITKHRIGFVLCLKCNGTFLWLSSICSPEV